MLLGKQGGKRAEGEMLRADAGDACPAHADGGGSFSSGTRRTDASLVPSLMAAMCQAMCTQRCRQINNEMQAAMPLNLVQGGRGKVWDEDTLSEHGSPYRVCGAASPSWMASGKEWRIIAFNLSLASCTLRSCIFSQNSDIRYLIQNKWLFNQDIL